MKRRYSVGVEFMLDADNEEEAVSLVSNFADSFPSQIDADFDPDVIVQDATEVAS